MKVAFVLTQDRGGPADLTVALARQISETGGAEVAIFGPRTLSSAAAASHVRHGAHIASKSDLAGARVLGSEIDNWHPDLIHAQDRRASTFASSYRLWKRKRIPLVSTFHGVPDVAAGRWVSGGPLHRRPPGMAGASRMLADAAVARAVDVMVAPSQAMSRFLKGVLKVLSPNVEVILNGVAIPNGPGSQPRPVARNFGSVGSFAPCKGMPLLVEAFARVTKRHPGLSLRLVGDGDEMALCQQLVKVNGISGLVEFTGYSTDVAAHLSVLDVFVLPSTNENMPLALLEAMASGRACVASSVGGVPEALDPTCGALVPPGDDRALEEAMEGLVAIEGRASTWGSAAQGLSLKTF